MNATLSLDLDNQWSYMKTHGDAGWETFPSYLDLVVPRVLRFLKEADLRITVLIVGQDAALPKNREALQSIAQAGHEIGNHSFHHEPWLHTRTATQIEDEIARAEEAIVKATGQRPVGFRGPGFTKSPSILRALARRGYAYDASTFPTFIGPLARAYYFRTAKLDPAAARERAGLFGRFEDGFERNRYHVIETAYGPIAEIPVTTMPGLRVPIHVSYLLYLHAVSPALAKAYFAFALQLCRLTRTEPSILLHPLDFLGAQDCPALRFFPAMNLPTETKVQVVRDSCAQLASAFTVGPLIEYVQNRSPISQVSLAS